MNKDEVTLAGQKVELVAAAEETTLMQQEKSSEKEGKKNVDKGAEQPVSEGMAEREVPARAIAEGSGWNPTVRGESAQIKEAVEKLRESGRRYGERRMTFAELEREGGILWVEVDKEGGPMFQMAPGAADEPLPERPTLEKKARKLNSGKAERKLAKEAKKAARERLKRKREAKGERLEAEFARLEEELAANAKEREVQEQLKEEQAAEVAVLAIDRIQGSFRQKRGRERLERRGGGGGGSRPAANGASGGNDSRAPSRRTPDTSAWDTFASCARRWRRTQHISSCDPAFVWAACSWPACARTLCSCHSGHQTAWLLPSARRDLPPQAQPASRASSARVCSPFRLQSHIAWQSRSGPSQSAPAPPA